MLHKSRVFITPPPGQVKATMGEPQQSHGLHYLGILICFHFFLVLCFSGNARSGSVLTTLPGYDGDLPFTLETGYIGVGDANESQFFYYFVESQRSPAMDPFMLWLTGGPGCSVLSAFFYESGPVSFIYDNYTGGLPQLDLNPYTWTKGINILYVDAPVGTGFSYSTTQENYYINDTTSANQTYQFLRRWLTEHPQFLTNQLFIGGDSYSGIPLPIIVQNILNGNEAGLAPMLNLKGYILGNPKTDDFIDVNSAVPFAHRMTLISNGLYEDTKTSCGGNYVEVAENNTRCVEDLNVIAELILEINLMQILEPTCQVASPRKNNPNKISRYLEEDYVDDDPEAFLVSKLNSAYWCRYYNYVLAGVWCNNRTVREALNVRENTTGVWKRCNSSIAYTKTVTSSVPYHINLTNSDLRALVYSGDHDLSVPHIGTENWIQLLNMTYSEYWRPWFVNGQVAGYTEKFLDGGFNMIYATVKGAGHVAPEYKPVECYEMIDRFMAYFPL